MGTAITIDIPNQSKAISTMMPGQSYDIMPNLNKFETSSLIYKIFCHQFNTCFGAQYLHYREYNKSVVLNDDNNKLYFDIYFTDYLRTIRRTPNNVYQTDVHKILTMFTTEEWNLKHVKICIVKLMFENFIDIQRFYTGRPRQISNQTIHISDKNIQLLRDNFFVFDDTKHTIASSFCGDLMLRDIYFLNNQDIVNEYEMRIMVGMHVLKKLCDKNILCSDIIKNIFGKFVDVYLKCELRLN